MRTPPPFPGPRRPRLGRPLGIALVACLAVAACSLGVALAATIARSGGVSRGAAASAALRALGVSGHTGAEIVFASGAPVAPGAVVAVGGPSGPSSAGEASGIASSPERAIARAGTHGAWLFYEDLAPYRQYEHAGRVALVDARTGAVTLTGTIQWPPLVDGQLPSFLSSQAAYLSPANQVFSRPYKATSASSARNPGSGRSATAPNPFGKPDVPYWDLRGVGGAAGLIAGDHSCVVRIANTLGGGLYAFTDVERTRGWVGSFFKRLTQLNSGVHSELYATGSGLTPAGFVQHVIARDGCRDVLIYLAGAGYPGSTTVNVGLNERGASIEHQDISAAALRSLFTGDGSVTFSLIVDAPYSSGFQGALAHVANLLLLALPGDARGDTFTYLPAVQTPSGLERNPSNPWHLLEYTSRLLFGLDAVIKDPAEVAQAAAAQTAGLSRSVLAWLLARALDRFGVQGFAVTVGLSPQPSTQTNGFTPSAPGSPSSPGGGNGGPPGGAAAPSCDALSITTAADTATTVPLQCRGAPHGYAVATPPAHGTLGPIDPAHGTVTYTPNNGFSGSDSFTYTATVGGRTSAPATVSITVSPPAAPTCHTVAVTAAAGGPTTVTFDCATAAAGFANTYGLDHGPSNGTLTGLDTAAGTVTYTPNSGYVGTDGFTYLATNAGGSTVATVSITVAPPPAPMCQAVPVSTTANTAATVTFSCTSTPGFPNGYTVVANPSHGTLGAISAAGMVTYTPNSGFNGSDSFTYEATNRSGPSVAATVSITVTPPPAPTCRAVSVTTTAATAASVTFNCATVAPGFANAYSVVANPSHGTLSGLNTTAGTVTYTPDGGFSGSDSFTYKATNAGGTSAAATVSIAVSPACQGVPATTPADTGATVTFSCTPAGTGMANTYAIASSPSHGTLSGLDTAAGTVTYTPGNGFNGSDSFTYTATNAGGTSVAATVSITVSPPAAPTCQAVSVTTAADTATSVTFNCPTVAAGFANTYAVVANPAHGTLSGLDTAAGTITYTPSSGYDGPDSFTYKATNAGGASVAATVSITVSPPAAPLCQAVPVSAAPDTATGVTFSCTSTAGFANTYAVVANPSHGTLSGLDTAAGTVTYTPANGFSGSDSFTYKATNTGGASVAATVSITVGTPAAPACQAVSVTTAADTAAPVTFNCATVAPGFANTYAVVANPAHGTLSGLDTAAGTVTYTPSNGFSGSDSFTYKATNAGGASVAATVSITVSPPAAPTCQAVAVTTAADTGASVTFNCPIVAAGFANTYAVVSNPAHGALSGLDTAAGTVTYTPDNGFSGSDSFTYQATNAGGASVAATVSITVNAPTAPTCQAVPLSAAADTAAAVTFSCTTTPGFANTYAVASSPSHGTLSGLDTAAGTITYTPTNGFSGSDSFTYTATNTGGTSVPATVSITVNPPAAPTCQAVAVTTAAGTGTSVTFNCPVVAAGFANTYAVATNPSHGTLSGLDTAAGTVTYTPAGGYAGPDSFTYTAANAGGTSSTATVSVTVTPPPVPTCQGVTASTTHNTPVSVQLACTDAAGFAITYGTVTDPAFGALSGLDTVNGTVTYTPTTGFIGVDSFTYKGTNSTGDSSPATATVTVKPPDVSFSNAVANTQYAVGTTVTGPAVTKSGSLLPSPPTEPNGDDLQVNPGTSSTTQGGSVTINSDGSFVYTPPAGFSGPSDTFTYTVSDVQQPAVAASATVTISFSGARVWYVDSAAATNGSGTSTSPFNTLSSLGAASAANDTVFLFGGGPTYGGGLTLKSGQTLDGQSFGLVAGGQTLLAASGANPTVTNAGGAGITLGEGTAVNGVTVSGTSGAGVTATNVNAFTLDSSDLITGAGGDALHVSGGGGTISDGAAITNPSGHPVSISGRTSGTVTNSGAISDATGTGISLASNAGATINFSGGIAESITSGTAFSATGGGTVDVTGAANTLTTTIGTALDVANTAIGASGLTFRSVSAGIDVSGPVNGVVLDNTGSGGLTVTGTGAAGSGGTIENTTGSAPGDGDVSLTSTGPVSLNDMVLTGTASTNGTPGSAVWAVNVSSLTVTNSSISNHATAGIFVSGTGSATPTFDIDHNTFSGEHGDPINVTFPLAGNTGTGTATGHITNNTIGSAGTAKSGSVGGEGIAVSAQGGYTVTADVSHNTVNQVDQGYGILAGANSSSAATPTLNLTLVQNNVTMQNAAASLDAISVTSDSAGSVACLNATGNTATAVGSAAQGEPYDAVGLSVVTDGGQSTFKLQGYTGAALDTTAVQNVLNSANTLSGPTNPADESIAVIQGTNTTGFSGGTCPTAP